MKRTLTPLADEHNEPTIAQLTPKLVPIFGKVLAPPEEQLEPETRELIRRAVGILHGAHPTLFQGHLEVLQLAGVA